MAFTKFATIVFLVGFLTAQVSCMIAPTCCHSTTTETTTTHTSTVRAVGGGAVGMASAMAATGAMTAGIPPSYYDGVPNYFNNGLPAYSRTYPFYSAFDYSGYNDLLSDYDINQQLASYSYQYGIPGTSLLSMYRLIHEAMPTLSPQGDLNMIRSLAEAWQAERLGYVQNYKHPLLDQLYTSHLYNYLPSDYPRPYMNMLGFLDSKIPRLSDSTYNSIYRAINDYAPSEYMSRVEYLNFALGTSMRYMSFNYAASWSMAY